MCIIINYVDWIDCVCKDEQSKGFQSLAHVTTHMAFEFGPRLILG